MEDVPNPALPNPSLIELLVAATRPLVPFLVLYTLKLGIRPGMGRPAFASLIKYFWQWDWTCNFERVPSLMAIFRHREASFSSGGISMRSSSSLRCSSTVHGLLKLPRLDVWPPVSCSWLPASWSVWFSVGLLVDDFFESIFFLFKDVYQVGKMKKIYKTFRGNYCISSCLMLHSQSPAPIGQILLSNSLQSFRVHSTATAFIVFVPVDLRQTVYFLPFRKI